jgi:hypothetical protein
MPCPRPPVGLTERGAVAVGQKGPISLHQRIAADGRCAPSSRARRTRRRVTKGPGDGSSATRRRPACLSPADPHRRRTPVQVDPPPAPAELRQPRHHGGLRLRRSGPPTIGLHDERPADGERAVEGRPDAAGAIYARASASAGNA